MNIPPNLLRAFKLKFGHDPVIVARAPGRINLLGEHVDYSDGWVLPAAIDRSAWLAVSPSPSPDVVVHALDTGEHSHFELTELDKKLDRSGEPLKQWARYPAGVAWSLIKEDLAIAGMRCVLTSDVPIGAGLSSSAAVEVVFSIAWQALSDWKLDPMRSAQVCQRAENGYVGVQCGLMDQFSSIHGVRDHALCFDTRTLEWEPVPLPRDVTIVIADSGVRRTLSQSAYNQRRVACEDAARLLSGHLPGIRALRDVSSRQLRQHVHRLPPDLRPIAQHVVDECERVRLGVDLLKDGDVIGFGKLMLEAHASLRDLYAVSSPELDALVEIAAGQPGCLGARLTGAGFGGCTVNLVKQAEAPVFCQRLASEYKARTGQVATVWTTRAADGAQIVPVPM